MSVGECEVALKEHHKEAALSPSRTNSRPQTNKPGLTPGAMMMRDAKNWMFQGTRVSGCVQD